MMPSDHIAQMFPAVCAGIGLFLAGLVNLLLVRRGFAAKGAATLVVFGLAISGAAALDQTGAATATAKYLGLALVPLLLLGSRRFVSGASAVFSTAHRPVVRFGLLTVAGLGVAVGSLVRFERTDDQISLEQTAELELMHGRVPSAPSDKAKAVTDAGTVVTLREASELRADQVLSSAEEKILTNSQLNNHIIRRGPADDRTNCHGWVFTGGQFLLGPDEVELILKENGYQEVHEPQTGDVAIYRQNGTVSHTALVRYVTEGQPVLVESKWGNLGVYLHPADRSVYGTDYTFYRTSRQGHVLAGLGGPKPTAPAMPTVAVE